MDLARARPDRRREAQNSLSQDFLESHSNTFYQRQYNWLSKQCFKNDTQTLGASHRATPLLWSLCTSSASEFLKFWPTLQLDVDFLAAKYHEVTKFFPIWYKQKWCVNFQIMHIMEGLSVLPYSPSSRLKWEGVEAILKYAVGANTPGMVGPQDRRNVGQNTTGPSDEF